MGVEPPTDMDGLTSLQIYGGRTDISKQKFSN